MVVVFWNVKVTRLGIRVSNASMMYSWSFWSAAVCASGSFSVRGVWSLWPRELFVMVRVFICLLPFRLVLEFFASLT